jgi:signal transduction histidine kinase
MADLSPDLETDLATIGGIEAVPSILQVIHHITGMGFAAVARVTEERWIACAVLDTIEFGLAPGGELKVETTLCHEIRQTRKAVVIDHVAEDAAYRDHPTPALYGFQSYISAPILRGDGSMFGTLCALDPRPHRLNTPGAIGMFERFAELIAFHIDSADRLASSEASLMDERKRAQVREQFIAVLGHDLRNPLASIDAGLTLMRRTPLNDKALDLAAMMQRSVARMSNLIANILDFAQGRLGAGLVIARNANEPLEPVLQQIVSEVIASHPDRAIEVNFDLPGSIDCDRNRIGQLFSNLLANAVIHGASSAPIRVRAAIGDGEFLLSVASAGEPIPPAAIKHLFQPFTRGDMHSSKPGLGLGLFIASEIARAHGGVLSVESSATETRFTFQMPLKRSAGDGQ